MRIGVIQASSQISKNRVLYELTEKNAVNDEVINFGCFKEETEEYSYVDIAFQSGMLLASRAVDFIVTGCSSGQGMMLACNSIPSVLCGYTPTPQDAYLFGRINNGNAVSVPLGLNYGWAGELNLDYTLQALFAQDFGTGYPKEDAERKRRDSELVKKLKSTSEVTFTQFLNNLDSSFLSRNLKRSAVTEYILEYGRKKETVAYIKKLYEKRPAIQR